MWGKGKAWLIDGGVLPDAPEFRSQLRDDLTGLEYGFDASNRIKLETKEQMAKRGIASPDYADALMLTWGANIASREVRALQSHRNRSGAISTYDPFA
jgi:phage terminase large subunit